MCYIWFHYVHKWDCVPDSTCSVVRIGLPDPEKQAEVVNAINVTLIKGLKKKKEFSKYITATGHA